MAKYKYTFAEAMISHVSQGLPGYEFPPKRTLPPILQEEMGRLMRLTADWEKLCKDLPKVPEFEVEARDEPESVEKAYIYLKGRVEALAVNAGSNKVVLNGGSQPTYRPSPQGHWIEDWMQLLPAKGDPVPWEMLYPANKPEYKLYPILRVRLSLPK